MEELMLKIDNVSKMYKLGQIGGTTLKTELQRLSAKVRRKEDPTTVVGSKSYSNNGETFMALNGVSFEVTKGERVGIIGHNGAGKSTLLKLISRVTAPTGGTIGLNGRVASMLEVGTGFHGELTGRENIYMNGAILGMTKKEIDAKIEDIIDFSEVRQFIDTPVKRYSSGMYVKLAFSVAAHLDSEIMIMDEVLAVGDMAFQKKCLDKMADVSRQDGRTILYVSHNMNTIRQLCDRVIVLDHGTVVFDGDVEEGIGVYMAVSADARISYDFETSDRKDYMPKVKLTGLDMIDTESNQFERGSDLTFVLHGKAYKETEEVFVRMEIASSDETVIGTTFSDCFFGVKKGESFDLRIVMKTDHLTPGRYTCAGLLFEVNQYGNQVKIDRVNPCMCFEIIPHKTDRVVWVHRFWGNVRFEDMQLVDISSNDEKKG